MEILIDPFEDKQSPVFCVCRNLDKERFWDIDDKITIDLTKNSFMQIGTLAIIAMLCNKSRHCKKETHGTYSQNSSLSNYMSRMNFFNVLGVSQLENFTRHPANNRFLEITKIVSEDNNNVLPKKLRDIVSKQSNIHPSLIDALDFSFGEVIDNVENHSRASIGGYVAAQYYPKDKYVEFCVVDDGIGIADSLKKNDQYKYFDADDLLIMAFNEGVGERVGVNFTGGMGHGCGLGLAFTARLVKASGGTLWAVSHENAAIVKDDGCESISGMYFPGTIICARIPSKAIVFESDLYSTGTDHPYSWNIDDICGDNDDEVNAILW